MDGKKLDRGFELQGLAMHRALTAAEREELDLLKSQARSEAAEPELIDPDGDGPLKARRPQLNGVDYLDEAEAIDRERAVARAERGLIAVAVEFLGRLFGGGK